MGYAEPYGSKGKFRARYLKPDGTMGSEPGFPNKTQAKKWALDQEAKIRSGGWVDPKLAQQKFGDWVVDWWEAQDLKPNSMDGYSRTIRTMILPHFAKWEIGDIRPIDVAKWEKRLRALGYKPSSIVTAHSRLHTILDDAVDNKMIDFNPAVRKRRRGKAENRPDAGAGTEELWTSPLGALMLAERCGILGGRDEDFLFVLLIAYTGMRLGEVIGLEKRYARAKLHGLIRVEYQLVEVKMKFHRHPPKGGRPRDVLLPPFLGPLVVDQVAGTERNFCRCEELHAPGRVPEYVFLGPQQGHHHRSNFYRRQFTPAAEGRRPPRDGHRVPVFVKLAGEHWPGALVTGRRNNEARAEACWAPIPVGNEERGPDDRLTPHGLRHSHKTWMIEDGIPEVAQFERLGHKLGGIRGVYSHPSDQLRQDILTALQKRWEDSLQARFEVCPHSPVPLLDKLLEPYREGKAGKDLHCGPNTRKKPLSRVSGEGL